MSFLEYTARDTVLHKLHTLTKVVIFLCISILAGVLWDYKYLIILAFITIMQCWLARVPTHWFKYGIMLIVVAIIPIFVLSIFQVNPVMFKVLPLEVTSKVIYTLDVPIFGRIGITFASMLWLSAMILRFIIIICQCFAFVYTTSPDSLAHLALGLRIPQNLVFIFSVAMRFIPYLSSVLNNVVSIQKLRGWEPPSRRTNPFKLLGILRPLAGPFVANVISLVDHVWISSQIRAFGSGNATSLVTLNLSLKDWIILTISVMLFIMMSALILLYNVGLL